MEGVVPPVQFRHAEEVIQRTETHMNIAVLKESMHRNPDRIEQKERLSRAQKDERTQSHNLKEAGVQGMKARSIQPVESFGAVMGGVEPPEKWDFMHGPVGTILAKL